MQLSKLPVPICLQAQILIDICKQTSEKFAFRPLWDPSLPYSAEARPAF